MDYFSEFPRRPRKRPRLAWDSFPKSQLGGYYEQDLGNVASYGSHPRLLPEHGNPFIKGLDQRGSPPWRDDDKDGHYMFAIGDNLTPRYKIGKKIGEGTFGQVLECWDRDTKEMVAIKVVRSIKKYREAAMIEIDVLQLLGKYDRTGSRCVQIRNWFDYRNHICIVFEMLGPSLFDFLRKNNYRPFPVDLVRELGRQLLECVAFLHDMSLIHTDLKPENILFVSSEHVRVPEYKVNSPAHREVVLYKRLPKSSSIKVIDFGSTAYGHRSHNYIVSTRHYRAPEVILGLGWSYPCDIWSVGCILVELCSGSALFQTHENLEHLAMMERVLGPIPQHMLKRVDRHAEKYVKRGRLDWPEGATSRESIKSVLKLPRIENLIMQHVDHSAGDLIDLVQNLLRYEPANRITAHQALRHPFFSRDRYRRY
ncbi:hypothetical protein MLD38_025486 [Melastoma candidum]|uniref:Uncharacterized protein n=1 Tax=Melastoma candidum TaxID=119954 RepID=A0ACB9NXA9_9MYRT|nr:hypothetical protein MLD38_025486 [Melastoma candidum]